MAIIESYNNNPVPVTVEGPSVNVTVDNQPIGVIVEAQPINVAVTEQPVSVTVAEQPVSVNVEESALPEGASVSLLQEVINTNITGGINRILDSLENIRAYIARQEEAVSRFLDMRRSENLFYAGMLIEDDTVDTPIFMNPSMGAVTVQLQSRIESSPLDITIYTSNDMKKKSYFSAIESIKLNPGSYKCLSLEGTMKFIYIKISPVQLRATSFLDLSVQKKIF